MGAVGYPFALLARKPAALLGAWFALAIIFFLVDMAFAAAGQDINPSGANGSRNGAVQLTNFITGLASLFATAFVAETGLVDLGRRSEAPSLGDGVLLFVLNLKFGFIILLPLGVIAVLGVGGAMAAGLGYIVAIAISAVVLLAFIFLLVRYFLAWPWALLDGKPSLFRAWALSRGHFWLLCAVLLVAWIVAYAPIFSFGVVAGLTGLITQAPIDSIPAFAAPRVLVAEIVQDVLLAFAYIYTAAVTAHLFNQVGPPNPGVAEEF